MGNDRLEEMSALVVGFGKTGKAVTRFLLDRGATVTVNDSKTDHDLGTSLREFKERGTAFILGSHPQEVFSEADLIIISPGVDPTLPAVKEARERGIPIISEVELASRFIDAPIIGITGTNGKTTTATLAAHLLRVSGYSVYLGGNIGAPLIDFVSDGAVADYAVVELSSFQLEGIDTFVPHIAALINITEDHLDRYSSFSSYREAKYRIFMNQTERDVAIINYDDEHCRFALSEGAARKVPFSQTAEMDPGIYTQGKKMFYRCEDGSLRDYDLSGVTLLGPHNTQNMLAAVATAEECGCDRNAIQEALEQFRGLEHRLEFVQEINSVSYYNDSKSTTIDSLLKALLTFDNNIILIAGGREKGGDYSVLNHEIKNRTKMLITIGEAQDKFGRLFGSLTQVDPAENLDDALALAVRSAAPGDVVLFSPGCASFDMFANYEERGKAFKKAARECAAPVNEGTRANG